MRDGRFKEAGLDKADHQIDWAASNTQVRDQALFFTSQQHLDGTAWLHCLFKGNMLGVMEMDELQFLQTQQAQTALDTAPHLRTGEDPSLQITVSLRHQHEAGRKPAKHAEHNSDATLALTITIGGGGIQKVEGTRKERTYRGQGSLLGNFVGEGLRH